MANEICERAMLVSLNIRGVWGAEVEDKEVGREVARDHQVSESVGRYMKKLLDPKSIPELRQVNSAVSELRVYFRENSLVWSDRGWRALPAAKYFEFTAGVQQRKDALAVAWEGLLSQYPALKEQARRDLNGLFKDADWPDPEELRRRFNVRVKVQPLTDASQFKALIGHDEEVAAIREQIEKDLFTSLSAGLVDLFRQLRVFLDDEDTGFIARVGSYQPGAEGKRGKTFRDSAVTKLRELCSRVRSLNVVGDPMLEEIVAEIESGVCKHNAEELRDNSVIRQQTVEQAESVAKKLAAVESILGRRLEAV